MSMLKLKTTAALLISMFLPFLLTAGEGQIRRSPQAVTAESNGTPNDDAMVTAAAADPVDFLHACRALVGHVHVEVRGAPHGAAVAARLP